jgi:hypothetical protein
MLWALVNNTKLFPGWRSAARQSTLDAGPESTLYEYQSIDWPRESAELDTTFDSHVWEES